MSDDSSDWEYFVTINGDYAREYPTLEAAEHARLHEVGLVPVNERRIWRRRTEVQEVYPAREAPHE